MKILQLFVVVLNEVLPEEESFYIECYITIAF